MARGPLIDWTRYDETLIRLRAEGVSRLSVANRIGVSVQAIDHRLSVLRAEGRMPPVTQTARNATSKAEAREMGVGQYFDGSTCMRGHKDGRAASSGECVVCSRERKRVAPRSSGSATPRACIGPECRDKPMAGRMFLSKDPTSITRVCEACRKFLRGVAA